MADGPCVNVYILLLAFVIANTILACILLESILFC